MFLLTDRQTVSCVRACVRASSVCLLWPRLKTSRVTRRYPVIIPVCRASAAKLIYSHSSIPAAPHGGLWASPVIRPDEPLSSSALSPFSPGEAPQKIQTVRKTRIITPPSVQEQEQEPAEHEHKIPK